MDAVQKADEALARAHTRERLWTQGGRLRVVHAVLDAVGYPAHEASDEGTCWCPVAEQAGRERDAARAERGDALVWMECELCEHNPRQHDAGYDCGHDPTLGAMCTFIVCGRCYNARVHERDDARGERDALKLGLAMACKSVDALRAERDHYREALESIALAPSAVADLRARAVLDSEGTP